VWSKALGEAAWFGCRANALVDFFIFWEWERNFLGASPEPVETPFLTIQFDTVSIETKAKTSAMQSHLVTVGFHPKVAAISTPNGNETAHD